MKDKIICEQCEKRPAIFERRSKKYFGARTRPTRRKDRRHAMCRQCYNQQTESLKQAGEICQ